MKKKDKDRLDQIVAEMRKLIISADQLVGAGDWLGAKELLERAESLRDEGKQLVEKYERTRKN
jgi:hypothetical protein